jgi:hypothetical protein
MRIRTFGSTGGHEVKLTYAQVEVVTYTPGDEETYCSECITLRDEIPCSKYFFAYNNEDAFGFTFFNDGITQYGLGARLRVLFKNAKYPTKNERYLGSDGTYRKTFAQSEKTWELKFDYVDEWTHDYIRLFLHSDFLQIGDSQTDFTLYSTVDDDYTPEWQEETMTLAQSTVEVQRASGTLFNTHGGL